MRPFIYPTQLYLFLFYVSSICCIIENVGGENIFFLKLHLQHEEIMFTEAYNPPYLIAWNSVLFKYLCTAFSEVQTPSFVFDSLFYNRVPAASIFYKNDIQGD